jgi:hypothetical protein
LLWAQEEVPSVTFTVAPPALAEVSMMVTPAAGSLKVWPTASAASLKLPVPGFMSSRKLLLPSEGAPVCTSTPLVEAGYALRPLSKPIGCRYST